MHTYIIQPYDMKLTHFFKMHTAVEFTAWQQSKFHESLELPRFPFGHIISLVRWVATSPQQRKPKDFCWDVRWLEKVCKLGLKRSWPVWAIRQKKENNIEKIDMNGIYIYILYIGIVWLRAPSESRPFHSSWTRTFLGGACETCTTSVKRAQLLATVDNFCDFDDKFSKTEKNS